MNSLDLASDLIELLKAQRKLITTIESCTGGLLAAAITRISGSSAIFEGGFVTYSNLAKTAMVGVPEYLFASHGAVSVEVAASMAEGGLKAAGAHLALSISGIAGPTGGCEEKPVGMVCFGLSYQDPEDNVQTYAQVRQFGDIGRDGVRDASVVHALSWAVDTLKMM